MAYGNHTGPLRQQRIHLREREGNIVGGRDMKEVTQLAKRNSKQTSPNVARKASAVLRDGCSSARTKSVAASALAQARPKRRK